jgi:hypothetical protein
MNECNVELNVERNPLLSPTTPRFRDRKCFSEPPGYVCDRTMKMAVDEIEAVYTLAHVSKGRPETCGAENTPPPGLILYSEKSRALRRIATDEQSPENHFAVSFKRTN